MIEKLTASQEKRLVEVREYWLKVGLNTERANRPLTEKTITQMYALLGRQRPRFVWVDSPFGAMISIHLSKKYMETGTNLGTNLWTNFWKNLGANLVTDLVTNLRADLGADLGADLRTNLRTNLWTNLGANLVTNLVTNLRADLRTNLWTDLWTNFGADLGANLGADLRTNLWTDLWTNLGADLRADLGADLRTNLWTDLWTNLRADLGANLGADLRTNLGTNLGANLFEGTELWGSLDAYWVSYYKFANEIGVSYSEKDSHMLNLWADLAHSCFWWWPYENTCFLSERPAAIHRNKEGRLHNEKGLAIEFHDGYGFFSLNGVTVPAWVVTTEPEKIETEKVVNERNTEVRRELIRKIGIERFIQKSGAKVLDKRGDYELLSVRLSDEVPDARYLKMKNPSIGVWHVEGVEGGTVAEAINWRAGNMREEWSPSVLT